jgi:hypothetical protein
MTHQQATQIAQAHGCMIGRHKPGLYYVTWADENGTHEIRIAGKTVKCAADWIVIHRPKAA